LSYAGIDLIDLANAAFKIADLPWHSAVHTHAPDSLKSIKLVLITFLLFDSVCCSVADNLIAFVDCGTGHQLFKQLQMLANMFLSPTIWFILSLGSNCAKPKIWMIKNAATSWNFIILQALGFGMNAFDFFPPAWMNNKL